MNGTKKLASISAWQIISNHYPSIAMSTIQYCSLATHHGISNIIASGVETRFLKKSLSRHADFSTSVNGHMCTNHLNLQTLAFF
jgi:hypothetical protein